MRQNRSKSGLFLIEMILVLLFLAIASAICARFFVSAHVKSVSAQELTHAEACVKGAAEVLRDDMRWEIPLEAYYPEGGWNGEKFDIFYDADWNICRKENARYRMEITAVVSGQEINSEIRMFDAEHREIYGLETVTHLRKTADSLKGRTKQ